MADRDTRSRFSDLVAARASRREVLGGLAAFAVSSLGVGAASPAAAAAAPGTGSSLGFASLPLKVSANDAVAGGYQRRVLIRWGDPVLSGAPVFDPARQSAAAQGAQFGFNNDYVAYLPLPRG